MLNDNITPSSPESLPESPENVVVVANSISAVSMSSTNSESTNSGQITQTQYITLLSLIEDMKKQLTRLEVKLDHHQNSSVTREHTIKMIDMAKLSLFGLPVKSKEELNVLEDKLKDEAFRNSLVSLNLLNPIYRFEIFVCLKF